MTIYSLQIRLGMFLILGHLGVLLLMMAIFIALDNQDELTTSFAIIAPMFAVYTTAIVNFIIAHKTRSGSKRTLQPAYVTIAFLFTSAFIIFLVSITLLRAFNFIDATWYKGLLLSVETLFGVYIGKILADLYDLKNVEAETESNISETSRSLKFTPR